MLLDELRFLAESPRTIPCKRMELLARDREEPIIIGTGELRLASQNSFEYTIVGKPADARYTILKLMHQQADVYDSLRRFRLVAIGEDDRTYTPGWTVPEVEKSDENWVFTGRFDGM